MSGSTTPEPRAPGGRAARPVRFDVQLDAGFVAASSLVDRANRFAALGYSAVVLPDHVGASLSPTVALASMCNETTIGLATLLLANDLRNPAVLAQEALSLQALSAGRFELGIGAGWKPEDYESTGIAFRPPKERIERLESALVAIRTSFDAAPSAVAGTSVARPPIIVGGGGPAVLSVAARRADVVGLNVRLGSGATPAAAGADAGPGAFAEKVEWVREAAGPRFAELELQVLVVGCKVTASGPEVLARLGSAYGLGPGDAAGSPILLIGTVDELAEQVRERRARFGITRFTIPERSAVPFAPVIEAVIGS